MYLVVPRKIRCLERNFTTLWLSNICLQEIRKKKQLKQVGDSGNKRKLSLASDTNQRNEVRGPNICTE